MTLSIKVSSVLIVLLISHTSIATEHFSLKGSIFESVANQYELDAMLLYAIALTESATGVGEGNISPHPYVFRSSQGAKFFKSKSDAEVELSVLLKTKVNIDIGMMQINLKYHPQPAPLRLLDPQYNLSVAAQYLIETMSSTKDPVIGVGRYHSWTNDRAVWYGTRVWQTYRNLKRINDF